MAKHESAGEMMGGRGVSPRKALAGITEAGSNFGTESFTEANSHAGHHPDHVAGTGAAAPLENDERAIGEPIHHAKHHHPAQAAPNHGPHHPEGYMFHQHEDHPEHRHETAHHKATVKAHPKHPGGEHKLGV